MATVYVDLPSEQVETVTVTAAEAIALNTTAKSLIAAPGANRTVQVVGVEVRMAGSVAFDGIAAGEDLVIRYTGETDVLATIETTGFLDQADRPSRQAQAAYTAAIRPQSNTAVELANSGAITDGSDLQVTIRYREFVDVKALHSLGTTDTYFLQARGGDVEWSEQAAVPVIGDSPSMVARADVFNDMFYQSAANMNLYAWARYGTARFVLTQRR